MGEFLFSVIVPIYNAENTLRLCVESILSANNELDNYTQIILVDDGSTDKSAMICKEFVCKRPGIEYIYQENKGVSAARNTGLDASVGEYIIFVDSDDRMKPDSFKAILQTIKLHDDADYYVFSYDEIKGENRHKIQRKNFYARGDDAVKLIGKLIASKAINSPCAKVYKRDIIERNSIRFIPGLSIAEDNAFNYAYSMYVSSVMQSSIPIYEVYTDDQDSLSRRKRDDLQEQFKIKDKYVNERLDSSGLSEKKIGYYKSAFGFLKYRAVYSHAKRMIQEGIPPVERCKYLRDDIVKLNKAREPYLKSLSCMVYVIPIKMRMSWLIDSGMRWIYKK